MGPGGTANLGFEFFVGEMLMVTSLGWGSLNIHPMYIPYIVAIYWVYLGELVFLSCFAVHFDGVTFRPLLFLVVLVMSSCRF